MPAPRNLTNLPAHAAVDIARIETRAIYGHTGPSAKVTCPKCHRAKWYSLGVLRQMVKKPNFTGICRPCWAATPKLRTFRTSRNPSGRTTTSNGYVRLGKNAIEDVDLDLFDAMRGKAGCVLEHRWVMAKHLGRALTPIELVDHMDGHPAHNTIGNLRIYIRGKQQPGSAPGYGTYYHEWQLAEARVRALERQLRHG